MEGRSCPRKTYIRNVNQLSVEDSMTDYIIIIWTGLIFVNGVIAADKNVAKWGQVGVSLFSIIATPLAYLYALATPIRQKS